MVPPLLLGLLPALQPKNPRSSDKARKRLFCVTSHERCGNVLALYCLLYRQQCCCCSCTGIEILSCCCELRVEFEQGRSQAGTRSKSFAVGPASLVGHGALSGLATLRFTSSIGFIGGIWVENGLHAVLFSNPPVRFSFFFFRFCASFLFS